MPTLLTRTITLALTEEDYAAIESRTLDESRRGCTPTEIARDLLLTALHDDRDPAEVILLAELLFIRRVLLNGPTQRATFDAIKMRDARLLLAGQPLPSPVTVDGPETAGNRDEG